MDTGRRLLIKGLLCSPFAALGACGFRADSQERGALIDSLGNSVEDYQVDSTIVFAFSKKELDADADPQVTETLLVPLCASDERMAKTVTDFFTFLREKYPEFVGLDADYSLVIVRPDDLVKHYNGWLDRYDRYSETDFNYLAIDVALYGLEDLAVLMKDYRKRGCMVAELEQVEIGRG